MNVRSAAHVKSVALMLLTNSKPSRHATVTVWPTVTGTLLGVTVAYGIYVSNHTQSSYV